ncbi:MAG: N(4)-(beta-N-acetylglucosaminyl)-L-asparaginase [Saprospiraceae bacterium]|nr:N(4)-(beta-N-acetylglucosaminyl)-L-asparaginase [Saprospiraceae bacterium]
MFNRRDFVRSSVLAALATAVSCKPKPTSVQKSNPHSKKGKPVVLATWDNRNATTAAMKALQEGGSALDAVEAGARVPEADPNDTSVGYGGFPDRDGHVTLDACIMDHRGNTGAVCFLEGIKHPISVARKVMEQTPHNMLCGSGALAFAREMGFPEENLLTEKSRRAWEQWLEEKEYRPVINIERHDTIGILALDAQGKLCGACTTSGMAFKMSGRVGDSPIIGAGLFVDSQVGGACATGLGELVTQTLGSFLIVELMRQGYSPQAACEEAVVRIINRAKAAGVEEYQAGFLALSKDGEHGAYAVVKGFNYALYQNEQNRVYEAGYKLSL